MKRPFIAVCFLVFALLLNIFAAVWINLVFDDMRDALYSSAIYTIKGDRHSATQKLAEFRDILRKNEQGLSLFIRRELVYDISESASTLDSYLSMGSTEDYCADATRTLETLRVVRGSMFTLS